MRGPTGVDDILNQLHRNTDNFDTISNASDSGPELEISTKPKKRGRKKKI